jgi:hypothetical protein
MKITLKNFSVLDLFPKETKSNKINGVHQCMSGAEYIVDLKKNELIYIGGVSPMFVHEDFPIGTGNSPKEQSMEKLRKVDSFLIEYHNLCEVDRPLTILDYNIDNPNIDELEKFLNHLSRIEPNSWECSGKEAITLLMETTLIKIAKKIGIEKFKEIMDDYFDYREKHNTNYTGEISYNWKYLLTPFPELCTQFYYNDIHYKSYQIDWVALIKHDKKYLEFVNLNDLYISHLIELLKFDKSLISKIDVSKLSLDDFNLIKNYIES